MGMQTKEELQDTIDITPDTLPKQHRAALIMDKFIEPSHEPAADIIGTETGEVTDAADDIDPLLQKAYAKITEYAEKLGETADDAIDTLTNGKVGCLMDLQDKSPAYLSDIIMLIDTAMAKES